MRRKRLTGNRRATSGRFERVIPLGREVNADQIEAKFKDGVLTVTLPKAASQENTRKIQVQRAA